MTRRRALTFPDAFGSEPAALRDRPQLRPSGIDKMHFPKATSPLLINFQILSTCQPSCPALELDFSLLAFWSEEFSLFLRRSGV